MKVLKLQAKEKSCWEDRRALFLHEQNEISLITDRGIKMIKEDLQLGIRGFCHGRFKANIEISTSGDNEVHGMKPGDQVLGKEVAFTIGKVGKRCHSTCPIYRKAGCSFLQEILFLEVETPGEIVLNEKLNYRKKGLKY